LNFAIEEKKMAEESQKSMEVFQEASKTDQLVEPNEIIQKDPEEEAFSKQFSDCLEKDGGFGWRWSHRNQVFTR
jgi:hypothetical protein